MTNLSGLPVKCPQCKRILFTTTDQYNPDVPPHGGMVKCLKDWHLDWLPTKGTKASELCCPECLGQLAHSGRLLVVMPKTESMEKAYIEIYTGSQPAKPEDAVDESSHVCTVVVPTEDLMHICPICGKECKNQLGLKSHMRSHEGKE